MPVAQITIRMNSEGAEATNREIKNVAASIDTVNSATLDVSKNSVTAFRAAAKEVLALVGAYKTLESAMDFARRGVNQSAEWEQSKIGIASVLASVREVRDEQGNLVKGAAAYQQALGMAEEAMQKIKILGLETTATSQDLVAGFQQLIGPAAAAGLTMQQTLDFTMSMVQSLGAIGIPFNQLSAEARSLLDGTIIPTQDRLATTLGITGEMVKNWKQQGVLAQMLLEKMSAFAAAGDDVAKTWNGVTSNLQDAINTVAMDASKGLYSNLKQSITEVNNLLVDTKSKTPGISKDFEHIVSVLEQAQTALGEKILSSVNALVGAAKSLNSIIGDQGDIAFFEDLASAIKILAAQLSSQTAGTRLGGLVLA